MTLGPPPPTDAAPSPEARILTRGPIGRTLLSLSWPVFVSTSLHMVFQIVDSIWVGRLGPVALGAVSNTLFFTWILIGLGEMLATGIVALAGRRLGAGDASGAQRASAQGILLAFLLAGVLAAGAGPIGSWLFVALQTPPEVTSVGTAYLHPLLLGSAPMLLMMCGEAILRAWGDTRTPMVITAVSVGLNVILDPLLILGWGPFPRWEAAGAAWATVYSQAVAALLFAGVLLTRRSAFAELTRHLRTVHLGDLVWISRVGVPTWINSSAYSIVYLAFARVAAQLGVAEIALLGVGVRLESISWILAQSLGAATSTMVAQNLGAGRFERARRTTGLACTWAVAITGILGVVFFFAGTPIFRAFTSDPEILDQAGPYLRILALCQPFLGIEVVLFAAFAGAGYTRVPSWIGAGISAVRVPLAFLCALTFGGGLFGLAWMITITCAARAIAYVAVFLTRSMHEPA